MFCSNLKYKKIPLTLTGKRNFYIKLLFKLSKFPQTAQEHLCLVSVISKERYIHFTNLT